MRSTKFSPIGSNVFHIYMDKTANDRFKGVVTNNLSKDAVEFTSLSKMILLIDSLMDAQEMCTPEYIRSIAEYPSFELEVLFRQNYSWQGKLRFPAERTEVTFRSVLELMEILETSISDM